MPIGLHVAKCLRFHRRACQSDCHHHYPRHRHQSRRWVLLEQSRCPRCLRHKDRSLVEIVRLGGEGGPAHRLCQYRCHRHCRRLR